jgi:hypothetical protein
MNLSHGSIQRPFENLSVRCFDQMLHYTRGFRDKCMAGCGGSLRERFRG